MNFRKKDKKPDPLQKWRDRDYAGGKESDPLSVFRQESEVAGMVDGRRHSGSGSSPYLKSDGSSDRYQIECKQTKHGSITLKLDWLIKISREAINARKGIVSVRFLNAPVDVDKDWMIIPASEFNRLYEAVRGEKYE